MQCDGYMLSFSCSLLQLDSNDMKKKKRVTSMSIQRKAGVTEIGKYVALKTSVAISATNQLKCDALVSLLGTAAICKVVSKHRMKVPRRAGKKYQVPEIAGLATLYELDFGQPIGFSLAKNAILIGNCFFLKDN